MRHGQIGILNVGAGDTKLTFDKNNPAESIRAARIVTDMLRRGYALLIEIEENGQKATKRVKEFDPETCEYIIADFDPLIATEADHQDANDEEAQSPPPPQNWKPVKKSRTKRIPASKTSGVAVAPTAGG